MYTDQQAAKSRKPVTVSSLRKLKTEGEKIACLTAYDSSLATLEEEAGVDLIMIGDSLGMVVQGHATTVPVSIDHIIYHTQCVTRAVKRPIVVGDMPFMSYPDCATAAHNAGRLMSEGGCQVVKLEGAGYVIEVIDYLTERDMPVCAHLGLTPQSIHRLGGYRIQGRTDEQAEKMKKDARAVQNAGAQLLVLECVPAGLAEEISQDLEIPVIGIGAGPGCDGQVLVVTDMLGLTPGKRPSFSKDFLADANTAAEALAAYVSDVKAVRFPAPEHCF